MQAVSRCVFVLFIALCLIGGIAKAQDHSGIAGPVTASGSPIALAGAPGRGVESLPIAKGFIRVRLRDGTIHDVRKPTFGEVADRNFWLAVAGSYAASVLDIEGEQHCARVDPNCREDNPLMGSTRARQYGVKMPMNALFVWGIYRYKRMEMVQHETGAHSHLPSWWVVGNVWTALNLATSIQNWRHAPAGVAAACPGGTSCNTPPAESSAY